MDEGTRDEKASDKSYSRVGLMTSDQMESLRTSTHIYLSEERMEKTVREYIGSIVSACQEALHSALDWPLSDNDLMLFVKGNVFQVVKKLKDNIQLQSPETSRGTEHSDLQSRDTFKIESDVPDLPLSYKRHGPVTMPAISVHTGESTDGTSTQTLMDTSDNDNESLDKNNSSHTSTPSPIASLGYKTPDNAIFQSANARLIQRPAPFLAYISPSEYSTLPPISYLPHYMPNKINQRPKRYAAARSRIARKYTGGVPPPKFELHELEENAYQKLKRYYESHKMANYEESDEEM